MNRKTLLDALNKVKPGLVTSKEVLEQTSSFVLGSRQIFSYNDEIALSMPFEGIDFTCVVPGKEFLAVLNKAKDEEIELELTESELVIHGKKFKAGIKIETEVKLPLDTLSPKNFEKLPKGFVEAVKLCIFSASKDLSRPELACLHIKADYIESCDRFRFTEVLLDKKLKEFLLPARSASELIKYDVIEYCLDKGWIHFRTKEGCLFSCRAEEGDYPNTDVIAEMDEYHIVKFPVNMKEIIERAAIALEGENSDITISIKEGTVLVESSGDVVRYKEEARIRSEKDNFSFIINATFLKDILERHSEAQIANDGTKMRFADDSFQHIVALVK